MPSERVDELEPCHHPDFEWFNPYLDSDDDMDEVLACTECGWVKWTAREVAEPKETTSCPTTA